MATANVTFGSLVGTALGGINQYMGVPFARPPVGALRFKDPVDWTAPYPNGSLAATVAGSVCVQAAPSARQLVPRPSVLTNDSFVHTPTDEWIGNESCLFLNVWAPQRSAPPRPVLLFVHGGAFIEGAGSEYNASTLALKHDVVVVTTNYRLGDLGFARVGDETNFGLKDQRSAMRW
eukprot:6189206-Prymnesium_polylepis.1